MPWLHHILYFPTYCDIYCHFTTAKDSSKSDENKMPPISSTFLLLTVTTSPLPLLKTNDHVIEPYKYPLAPANPSHWTILIGQLAKKHLALNSWHKLIISLYLKQEEDNFDLLWSITSKTFVRQPGNSHCITLYLTAMERREEKRVGCVHPEEPLPQTVFEAHVPAGLNYRAERIRTSGTYEPFSVWVS